MADTKLLKINGKEITVQSVTLDAEEVFPGAGYVDPEGVVKNEPTGPNQVHCAFENEQAALFYEGKTDLTLEFDQDGQPVKVTGACAYGRQGRMITFRGFKED